MSIQYLPAGDGGPQFSLSYSVLKEEHRKMVALSDAEFMTKLPAAAHLACIIGWLKELGPDATIGDEGIVHELIHLMDGTGTTPLEKVRTLFATVLALA